MVLFSLAAVQYLAIATVGPAAVFALADVTLRSGADLSANSRGGGRGNGGGRQPNGGRGGRGGRGSGGRKGKPKRGDSSDEEDAKPSAEEQANDDKSSPMSAKKYVEKLENFVTEKMAELNRTLDDPNSVISLESLTECYAGTEELYKTLSSILNPCPLYYDLCVKIFSTQEKMRRRKDIIEGVQRELDRRHAPAIAEEGTTEAAEAASAAGLAAGAAAGRRAGREAGRRAGADAGKKAAHSVVKQETARSIDPVIQRLQRAGQAREEHMRRLREEQAEWNAEQERWNAEHDRRMAEAEEKLDRHDEAIERIGSNQERQEGDIQQLQQALGAINLQQQPQLPQQVEVAAVVSDEDTEVNEEEGEEANDV